jgi:aldehyde:ferredoxin oxidoreductase
MEQDLRTGLLNCAYWGYPNHYDPRAQADWGFGSILSERDVNEHEVNSLFWIATRAALPGSKPPTPRPLVPAADAARILAEKIAPGAANPELLNFAEDNLYSENMARLVAWHRHFTRFWRESALFCDFRWSEAINTYAPGNKGALAEAEEPFFAAVTGRKLSISEGTEIGRRIWNLDNAIWVLQGRHRSMVRFPEFIYSVPLPGEWPQRMPGRENGEWKYLQVNGRRIDERKFEEWKTRFYAVEGWAPDTGWPYRRTLDGVSLPKVAGELAQHGKLGQA